MYVRTKCIRHFNQPYNRIISSIKYYSINSHFYKKDYKIIQSYMLILFNSSLLFSLIITVVLFQLLSLFC